MSIFIGSILNSQNLLKALTQFRKYIIYCGPKYPLIYNIPSKNFRIILKYLDIIYENFNFNHQKFVKYLGYNIRKYYI